MIDLQVVRKKIKSRSKMPCLPHPSLVTDTLVLEDVPALLIELEAARKVIESVRNLEYENVEYGSWEWAKLHDVYRTMLVAYDVVIRGRKK